MKKILGLLFAILTPLFTFASELELEIPDLGAAKFDIFGASISGTTMLYAGIVVVILGLLFGMMIFNRVKALPAHKSMLDISNLIYETCKTYLIQQGRLLIILELFIIACIVFYFGFLIEYPKDNPLTADVNEEFPIGRVATVGLIIFWSIIGILGSYSVAWFGIRINTYANSRTAFSSLTGKPFGVMNIPLQSGMSIGVVLICVELLMMLIILLFMPAKIAGACFVGFAIGESLGASALRICGGIFTKIADIGADLMKIVFNIKEDDVRNPGVIADCTGDNAGDSVGPTADGFETYGVTGVALISFILLAVMGEFQASMIVWIFVMRVLMVITSIGSYLLNQIISKRKYEGKSHFDFEAPLTNLIWITSLISILVTYGVSYLLLDNAQMGNDLWWHLATIISCGTLAAAVIPELTKVFTSSKSAHVREVVDASREGGASLTILSGLVAGNFSAFWKGLVMVALMFIAYLASKEVLDGFMIFPSVFAFGLVAFGFLGMGPVTIAVDSYGPVTDNAQSVFELSQIGSINGIDKEIENDFGFQPNFIKGKELLEENDSAGNTFKATAKPVLIGTAVVGATTMIFAVILSLQKHYAEHNLGDFMSRLTTLDPMFFLGLVSGGAVIYWFSGASMQAVTTGAYRAVEYIKKNINLESTAAASIKDSKEVVKICTQYAQTGMWNIFAVIFTITLAFAFFSPQFFIAYLISLALFGLYQAMFMANAGGAWDNAKKLVEVDLKEKGTALHAATVVGDTVGDPFKDTTSVALNPIIKFSTLFGLLAVEIAVNVQSDVANALSLTFFVVALYFVYRSFYGMRIHSK